MSKTAANIERRALDSPIQYRDADTPGTPGVFWGYAAMYNRESVEMRLGKIRFTETILPGAFDEADFSNVIARFNHDSSSALARTPESLRLCLDETGLRYEFDYDPEDPEHKSLMSKMKRNVVRGSSFQFALPKGGSSWDKSGEVWKHTITKIAWVGDVAPVLNPAYRQTKADMTMRSVLDDLGEETSEFEKNRAREKALAYLKAFE